MDFREEVAIEFGFEAAVVLQKLAYFVQAHRIHGANEREGRHWNYATLEKWCVILPYIKPATLRRVFDELVAANVLKRDSFNRTPFDRTTWLAFENEELWLEKLVGWKKSNDFPFAENDKSICGQPQIRSAASLKSDLRPASNDHVRHPRNIQETSASKTRAREEPPAVAEIEEDTLVDDWTVFANGHSPSKISEHDIRKQVQALRYETGMDAVELGQLFRWAKDHAIWSSAFVTPKNVCQRKHPNERTTLEKAYAQWKRDQGRAVRANDDVGF